MYRSSSWVGVAFGLIVSPTLMLDHQRLVSLFAQPTAQGGALTPLPDDVGYDLIVGQQFRLFKQIVTDIRKQFACSGVDVLLPVLWLVENIF